MFISRICIGKLSVVCIITVCCLDWPMGGFTYLSTHVCISPLTPEALEVGFR